MRPVNGQLVPVCTSLPLPPITDCSKMRSTMIEINVQKQKQQPVGDFHGDVLLVFIAVSCWFSSRCLAGFHGDVLLVFIAMSCWFSSRCLAGFHGDVLLVFIAVYLMKLWQAFTGARQLHVCVSCRTRSEGRSKANSCSSTFLLCCYKRASNLRQIP